MLWKWLRICVALKDLSAEWKGPKSNSPKQETLETKVIWCVRQISPSCLHCLFTVHDMLEILHTLFRSTANATRHRNSVLIWCIYSACKDGVTPPKSVKKQRLIWLKLWGRGAKWCSRAGTTVVIVVVTHFLCFGVLWYVTPSRSPKDSLIRV